MLTNQILDYEEKMWFLGTDLLPDHDLNLMEKGKGAAFNRDEGAITARQGRAPMLNMVTLKPSKA